MTFVKPCLLACLALALHSLGCVAEVEDEDPDFRFAAQQAGGECEEEYYFVVDGATKRDAQAACNTLCEGIICPDPDESATACIPGNAGDSDTWKCDCKCGCDDDEAACIEEYEGVEVQAF